MNGHATLAPSSAPRWAGQCPASVQMEAAHPDSDDAANKAAAEGVAAHWIAHQIFNGLSVTIGATAPNGVVIEDEMIEAAEIYVADVRLLCGALNPRIEETITVPRVHADDNWGTPDSWLFIPQATAGTVILWDFKYGHKFVDAFENWQLIDYAAGLMDHDLLQGYDANALVFVLRVVQPRNYQGAGPVRSWSVNGRDLLPFIERLKFAAAEAMGAFARANTGPQCDNCRARHACTVLQDAAYGAADMAGQPSNLTLPASALGVELRLLRRAQATLEARIDGLEQQALSLIKGGQSVPGWLVAQTTGREKWVAPAVEIFALADACGVDVRKPPEPITPNQARQKGLDKSITDALATRPGGAIKLVPAENTLARKVFHG